MSARLPTFPLKYSIRAVREGCANRPFYHINVLPRRSNQHDPPIEQLGVFDPMPNDSNEKLVAINFERLKYWMAQDVAFSNQVAQLLGLSGYLPIYPRTYMTAWKNRRQAREEAEKQKAADEAASQAESKQESA